jgi:protein N-lysine methyltransferase METTL21A
LLRRPCRYDEPNLPNWHALGGSPYSRKIDTPSLELGVGGGLAGLAIARGCQTKSIPIADQLPMLSLMRQNIALNSLEAKVTAEILDWGTPVSSSSDSQCSIRAPLAEERYPDVVLAAGWVYFETRLSPALANDATLARPENSLLLLFQEEKQGGLEIYPGHEEEV